MRSVKLRTPHPIRFWALAVLGFLVTCLGGCRNHERMTLTLFAAASLRYSIEEAETYYKQSHSNVDFSNNFGSSATVADQIDQGAPVDVFISAAAKPMDDLGGKGLIVEVRALIC